MPKGLEKTLNEVELNIICAYASLMQDEVKRQGIITACTRETRDSAFIESYST